MARICREMRAIARRDEHIAIDGQRFVSLHSSALYRARK
jgi:hypothetical protein